MSLMSSNIIAKRYAQALFAAAKEKSCTTAVLQDLKALAQALAAHADFSSLFYHLQLTSEQKRAALAPVLEELLLEPMALNFVFLLFKKKRESFFLDIVAAYQAAVRQARGEVVGTVTSIRELNEAELSSLGDQVKQLTGCQTVELRTKVDKSILGGLVLQIGDTIYDGSLARVCGGFVRSFCRHKLIRQG